MFRPRRAPLTYVRATTPEGAQRRAGRAGRRRAVAGGREPAGRRARRPRLRGAPRGGRRRAGRPRRRRARRPARHRRGERDGDLPGRDRRDRGRRGAQREHARPQAARDPRGHQPGRRPGLGPGRRRWRRPAPPRRSGYARWTGRCRCADHEDFARGYAGVGPARADLLWDGRVQRVLLTRARVAGERARAPTSSRTCTPRSTWPAIPGRRWTCWRGNGRGSASGSSSPTTPPTSASPSWTPCIAALDAAFGAPARAFAAPVTEAGVLVVVRSVPGVAACTVPRLFPLATIPEPPVPPTLPGDDQARDVVTAQTGPPRGRRRRAGAAARTRRRRGPDRGDGPVTLLPSTDATERVLALLPDPRPRAGRRVRRADRARCSRRSAASSTSSNATSTPSTRPGSSRPARSGSCPYLADLVGVADLPPDLPGVTSRRAFVANTVRYRRARGRWPSSSRSPGTRRAGRLRRSSSTGCWPRRRT